MNLKDSFLKYYESLYLYLLKKKMHKARATALSLPVPVISIGNLTVGGTGKTPMVITVAREAKKRGFDLAILSRGYKGRLKGPALVSCRTGPLLEAIDAGDEPVLMARKLYGIPVVIGKDRYEAGMYAMECFKERPNMFILDDGFQHWRLKREIDIVLLSGISPFGNRRLFPFGPLREPPEALKRAHILVITMVDKAKNLMELIEQLRHYNRDAPLYLARHTLKTVTGYRIGDDGIPLPVEEIMPGELRGKRVIAFAGIGNPESFRLSLEESGVEIINFIKFMDHHLYTASELQSLFQIASETGALLITTEKDLVRAEGRLPQGEIYTLNIEISIEDEFFDRIFNQVLGSSGRSAVW